MVITSEVLNSKDILNTGTTSNMYQQEHPRMKKKTFCPSIFHVHLMEPEELCEAKSFTLV